MLNALEKVILATTMILLLLSLPSTAVTSDGAIGVFADLQGTECSVELDPTVADTLYVFAVLKGRTKSGIQGAEFRIHGFPPEVFVVSVSTTNTTVVLPDPLQGGTNVAFGSCQPSTTGRVLLYTLIVFPLESVPASTVIVDHKLTPVANNFPCPVLVLCDSPVFTGICISGRSFEINRGLQPCVVSVESQNWSAMKALYR